MATHFSHIENGGINLARMIDDAQKETTNDVDLRNRFALIHQYALALLRDVDKEAELQKQRANELKGQLSCGCEVGCCICDFEKD